MCSKLQWVASLSSSRIQLSLSSLKTFLDKKEETLLESFYIVKKVCPKLVLVSR